MAGVGLVDWRGIQGTKATRHKGTKWNTRQRGNTGGMENTNLKIWEFENLKMNTNTRRTFF